MKPMIAAGLAVLFATGAFAQTSNAEVEIAPGMPALGIESGSLPVLALLSPADDPLAYPDLLDVGSVGAPGLVAFDLDGKADPDIATGSLGPVRR